MLYTVLGAQWLFIEHGSRSQLAFPLGLIIGILFAHNERFQIDRKIEYAVLLVAMLIGYFSQIGLIITL